MRSFIQSIEIPQNVPVMVLPNLVMFPYAILSMVIEETHHYKQMLKNVIQEARILAIAKEAENEQSNPKNIPERTASLAIIRVCRKNDDGSLTLIIQGLSRVKILGYKQYSPYKIAHIAPLCSTEGAPMDDLYGFRKEIQNIICSEKIYGPIASEKFIDLMEKIKDPETFIDLTAFAFCQDIKIKQELLEILNTADRYKHFIHYLKQRSQQQKWIDFIEDKFRRIPPELN